MISDQQRLICLHRMERAVNTLREARVLFSNQMPQGTVNRIYYAMFYAVGALALAHGFRTSTHTGLQSWFNQNILRKGLIEANLGKLYHRAFELRNRSDYTDLVELDAEVIGSMLEQAEPFIGRIEELLMEQLQKEK